MATSLSERLPETGAFGAPTPTESASHSLGGSVIELVQQNRQTDTEASRPPSPGAFSPENGDGANVATIEDIPPDGGYGWVCTFCVFLINANTWGVNSSWGIFLDRYVEWNTFPGATKLQYSMIGGLSIASALFIAPVTAASQKYLGTRPTMLLGALITFAGLFSVSAATQIWHVFMSFAFCFGWGMGLIYIPAMAILPPWFSSRRSLALGFATSGAGMGGLAYSLITGRLINITSTTWTWRILGLASLSMNVVCSLILRERAPLAAARATRRPFNFHDFLRTQVILVLIWGLFTEFGYVALWYNLPSYATSIGLNPTQGSVVQALLSVGLGVGRPIVGYYSDKVGRINMALGTTLMCAVLCLALWIPARNYAGLVVFAATAGVVAGTFWSTVNPVLAEVVGIAEAGSVFGSICFALVLPTTFGGAIALELVQGTGMNQFLPSQIFVGFMFIAGSLALIFLRSWKIYEVEMKAEAERLSVMPPEAARNAALAGVRSSLWFAPKRMFMPRRV